MSDFGRRFDASELDEDEVAGNATAAELLAIARDLESYARSDSVTLSVDFEDRVMAAIADEPPPRPVGYRGPLGIVGVVRDAWRLAWSADRPVAVRAQAFAFVLLAAAALGSLGSLAVVGVGALLSPDEPAPTVQPAPLPTPSPSLAPSLSPTPSVSPSPSPTPSASPTETAEPTESAGPTETPEGTDDSSGPGSGSGSDSSGPGSGGDSSGPGSGGDSSGSGSGG
jgi:uncharacterized membrane protein YgcG